jgi:hypothetical protein
MVTIGVCLLTLEVVDSFQRLICAGFTLLIGAIILSIGLSSLQLNLQTNVSAEVAASGFAAILAGMGTILKIPATPSGVVIAGVVTWGISIVITTSFYFLSKITSEDENLGIEKLKKLVSYLVKISFFFVATLVNFGILYYIPKLI